MKNVYFLSDAHLGSLALSHRRMQERRLVNFLDRIKHKAAAVYLLGDMFDFWHEYRTVVPKGYTRFLGKISELTDHGVEVHFFTGNHDLWVGDYLETECGVTLHRDSCTTEIYGHVFYLATGSAPRTGNTASCAPCSTTPPASAFSPPSIRGGAWPSDSRGQSTAA